MNRTRIEWTDFTWNPVVGCTGSCPYCYARKMAHRFHRDFTPHWVEKNFSRAMPRKPSRIFVNSMSDLADWENDWFDKVTTKIATHPEHRFLFLSKRPWACPWTSLPNAMLGYSVTRQADYEDLLERGFSNVNFLSIEPLLGHINLRLYDRRPDLRWIIVGSETGNRKERVVPKQEWLAEIDMFCVNNRIPLFFKDSLRTIWPSCFSLPQEYPVLWWR